jgi:hypothetical protein
MRAKQAVFGAQDEVSRAMVVVLLLLAACGPSTDDGDDASSSSSSSSDGGERCVCDAFGPPGVFEPTDCAPTHRPCCDYDGDENADPEPTRLVCFGGES